MVFKTLANLVVIEELGESIIDAFCAEDDVFLTAGGSSVSLGRHPDGVILTKDFTIGDERALVELLCTELEQVRNAVRSLLEIEKINFKANADSGMGYDNE